MDDDWQPLEGTLQGENAGALHEGTPPWLVASLREWVRPSLMRKHPRGQYGSPPKTTYYTETMREMERKLRTTFDWKSDGGTVSSVMDKAVKQPEVFLGVVDFVLHRCDRATDSARIERLEAMLLQGGSAWRVSDEGRPRLVRRVDATYEATARKAMEHGKAGRLLNAAWTAAYGREPQASYAYQQAVRAVEAAAQPVVLPQNDKATLGQIIPAIKDKPDKWMMPIDPPDVISMVVIAEMMQLLWRGQHDRHGTGAEDTPLHVELAETLAALPIAVGLVELFSSGSIRPR